ncbi:uncharacterized protein LOC136090162 [Hydra vulgaris]|uniref:Uncharacterized protein LOC136090162 n=1 Tax=Hydra vulgaris TaxID=6087 RepID=A0ABM4DD96_HYDVU
MSTTSSIPDELASNIFGTISYEIAHEWYRFGRHLGLRCADINNIGANNTTVAEKADNVLRIWKQNHTNFSWEQLKSKLISFNRSDIVILIERKYRDELLNQRNSREKIAFGATLLFLLATFCIVYSFPTNDNFLFNILQKIFSAI